MAEGHVCTGCPPAASCRHSRVRRRVCTWHSLLSGRPWARAKYVVSRVERLVPPRTGGLTEEAEAPSASRACAWGGLPRDPTSGVQGRSSLLRAILGGICVPRSRCVRGHQLSCPRYRQNGGKWGLCFCEPGPLGCVYEHLCSQRLGFLCLDTGSGHYPCPHGKCDGPLLGRWGVFPGAPLMGSGGWVNSVRAQHLVGAYTPRIQFQGEIIWHSLCLPALECLPPPIPSCVQ